MWGTLEYFKGGSAKPEVVLNACVNNLIKRAMIARSEDNLSVIIIFLKPLF